MNYQNQYDLRDAMRSLDPRYRYMPTSREYGAIMHENRQRRSEALRAAREKAKMVG